MAGPPAPAARQARRRWVRRVSVWYKVLPPLRCGSMACMLFRMRLFQSWHKLYATCNQRAPRVEVRPKHGKYQAELQPRKVAQSHGKYQS